MDGPCDDVGSSTEPTPAASDVVEHSEVAPAVSGSGVGVGAGVAAVEADDIDSASEAERVQRFMESAQRARKVRAKHMLLWWWLLGACGVHVSWSCPFTFPSLLCAFEPVHLGSTSTRQHASRKRSSSAFVSKQQRTGQQTRRLKTGAMNNCGSPPPPLPLPPLPLQQHPQRKRLPRRHPLQPLLAAVMTLPPCHPSLERVIKRSAHARKGVENEQTSKRTHKQTNKQTNKQTVLVAWTGHRKRGATKRTDS